MIRAIEEISEAEAVAALAAGATLLTCTHQLAIDWKRRFIESTSAAVCETPNIYSWQAWLTELAAGQATIPVALNSVQETRLWEQVIESDLPKQTASLLRGLAAHASDAYALMQEYRIDTTDLVCNGEEAEALARWINAIRCKLNSNMFAGRMLSADLGQHLLPRMQKIINAESIMLDGFESFTPMQQQLLGVVQTYATELMRVKTITSPASPALYVCADALAEYRHVASRVRDVLETTPPARIAIATSDSISDLSLLKRVLGEVLMPGERLDSFFARQAVAMPGDSLIDFPMIRQLLHLFAMAGERMVSFDDISALLFCPWLKGYKAERVGRARLDVVFRKQNRHRMAYKSLLNSSRVRDLPEFQSIIRMLATWNRNSRSVNDWLKAVHELLNTTGFVPAGQGTHDIARSNHEIRQINAFHDALVSLVAVDAVDQRLSWGRFLSLLRTACSEVRIALTAKYSHVVVMPLARLSGLTFDHLFVMGLDEEAFPPSARPHPLLPSSLQKMHAIPMSSGELVYKASQDLWTQLLQVAPNIEISYAKHRDEREMLPSSFLAQIEPQSYDVPDMEKIQLPLENFDDAPNVPLGVNEKVCGGTSIIKNQSDCPFRAFATHRLGISGLEETSPGIEPKKKGSLIHLALEYIWKQLESRQTLAALGVDSREKLIDTAIGYAWDKYHMFSDRRTQEYERKRMRSVLSEWLQLEMKRPDFRVIGTEQMYQMHLPSGSGQQFSVKFKADRMDEDESGRRILIDYKTGAKQSRSRWLKERIEEPQLPQYALAAGLGVDDAVAFARLRSGDMAYEGLCGEDIGISGIVACDGKRGAPQDWQQVLDEWKKNIDILATEFVNGRCDVAPRDTNSCRYCGFESICRIKEIGFNAGTGDSHEEPM